jgi:hypothetical protein
MKRILAALAFLTLMTMSAPSMAQVLNFTPSPCMKHNYAGHFETVCPLGSMSGYNTVVAEIVTGNNYNGFCQLTRYDANGKNGKLIVANGQGSGNAFIHGVTPKTLSLVYQWNRGLYPDWTSELRCYETKLNKYAKSVINVKSVYVFLLNR